MPIGTKMDVAERAKILKETRRTLNKMQLGAQTPAARSEALLQKRARVEVAEIRTDLAIKGTLARICEEIGLHRCLLDKSGLRGVLLLAMDSDRDPVAIQRYLDRDEAFQKSRKKDKVGIAAFISVAAPSVELVEKAREIGLKQDLLVGGFKGRAALGDLIDLGERFSVTVRVEIKKSAYLLVNAGEVDMAVFEMLGKDDINIQADTPETVEDDGVVVIGPRERGDAMDNEPPNKRGEEDDNRDREGELSGSTMRRPGIGGPLRRT